MEIYLIITAIIFSWEVFYTKLLFLFHSFLHHYFGAKLIYWPCIDTSPIILSIEILQFQHISLIWIICSSPTSKWKCRIPMKFLHERIWNLDSAFTYSVFSMYIVLRNYFVHLQESFRIDKLIGYRLSLSESFRYTTSFRIISVASSLSYYAILLRSSFILITHFDWGSPAAFFSWKSCTDDFKFHYRPSISSLYFEINAMPAHSR